VPAPSPDAANVATGIADNNPAKSSEVILKFIMVVSWGESFPDVGVKGRAVGFAHAALSVSCRMIG
jgi:hypothetical protein